MLLHSKSLFRLPVLLILGLALNAHAEGDILRRGISLIQASRGMEAERVLLTIGSEDSDYLSAQIHLGFLFLQRSAIAEAKKAFRTVLRQQPENAAGRLGLGVALLRSGLPLEAGNEFQQILTDSSFGLEARIQWIHSLAYEGKFEKALLEAKRLCEKHPSVAQPHRLLGFLYQMQGEMSAALRAYLQSIQLEPDELSAYFSLITIYQSQNDLDQALHWAQKAIEVDSNHPLLYIELAKVYEKLEKSNEAQAAWIEAERAYDAEILYTQAVRARIAGRPEEAKKLLRDCTVRNPRLAKAWTDLGELLQSENHLGEAQQAFHKALELSPLESRALLGLVTTLQSEGNEEEALLYLKKTVDAGQISPDLLTAMADSLLKQGKTQSATAAALQAVHELPDDPDLISYLGYLLHLSGKDQEALESYSVALRLDPNRIDALIGRAQSQLGMGKIRSATTSFLLVQELDPLNPQIQRGLIQAYLKAGKWDSAESSCRTCLEMDPQDIECREQLAWLRMRKEDYRECAEHLQFLLGNNTTSKKIVDGLAYSLLRIGEFPEAIELFESSLEKYGPDAYVYSNLGFLYRCVGNINASVSNYFHARDLAPADAEIIKELGIALYLSMDYPRALYHLQAAMRLQPEWKMGYYHLAMVYWNLKEYELALSHARLALKLGVQEADNIIQSLIANTKTDKP